MADSKVSDPLRALVQSLPERAVVDVVLELRSSSRRPAEASARRALADEGRTFDVRSAPVTGEIERLQGEVTGRVWLNDSIRARVPASAIDALASLEEVERVDVPRRIQAESALRR